MPNTVNQQRQLAALVSKQNKTQADLSQMTALERKLANKTAQPQRQKKRRTGGRAPASSLASLTLADTPLQGAASAIAQGAPRRDGTQAMMTPTAYKQLLMSNSTRVGSTAAGRAYYHQALHPPSAPDADFAGLPDYTSQPRVTPQYVTNADVKWDTALFDTPPTTATSFGIYMAVPDVPEIAWVYQLHDETNDVWSNLSVVRTTTMDTQISQTPQVNSFTGMMDLGFSMTRMTSSSICGIYSGTTLGDAGMIYAASISPLIDHQEVAVIGQVVPAGTNSGATPPIFTGTPVTPFVENDWQLELAIVPRTAKAMMQADPSHYRARARQGVYATQKFDTSLLGYTYTECGSGSAHGVTTATTGGTVNIYGVDHVFGLAISDTHTEVNISTDLTKFTTDSRLITPATWGVNFQATNTVQYLHGGITPHSGMAWSIIKIEGLSVAQAEQFAFERRITLDSQVPANSSMQPFLKLVPDWDEMAIKAVMNFHRRLPSGMPSDCNGFMDWVRGIFGFLNKNRGPILDVVKALPIPGAAIAADVAENVLPTVAGMLGGSTV